jgi:hypothetical protein
MTTRASLLKPTFQAYATRRVSSTESHFRRFAAPLDLVTC